MIKRLALITLILMRLHATAQPSMSAGKIMITFDHVIGAEPLALNNTYVNAVGDTLTIQKFRYYVSNFSIITTDHKAIPLKQEYFLVDEAEPTSKNISLAVPAGVSISAIRFMLGVDSIRNVSGVQSGALDPTKGMFWTWNSGYIMAKLEGNSPAAHVAGNMFTYHIGGFRQPMQTMRMIELLLSTQNHSIHIVADINKWFKGNSVLHISETPVCHSPGKLAARIADNYANMFSIKP